MQVVGDVYLQVPLFLFVSDVKFVSGSKNIAAFKGFDSHKTQCPHTYFALTLFKNNDGLKLLFRILPIEVL